MLCALFLCASTTLPALPSLKTLTNMTTISGLSSGAYMAVQMHISFSREFIGAGAVAGGPFYCAQANLITAQTSCMKNPALISVPQLVQITKNTVLTGTLDPLLNLKGDRAWILSGMSDSVVHPQAGQKLLQYYQHFLSKPEDAVGVFDIPSEHTMPVASCSTTTSGRMGFECHECDYLGTPYINNCSYDTVGNMFQHLYRRGLQPPVAANATGAGGSSLHNFSQLPFIPAGYTRATASLDSMGVLLVPSQCSSGETNCFLHVALHGCLQGQVTVGSAFYTHAGYREWAEANNIVVLFPQGVQYASKLGAQMQALINMVRVLQGR